VTTVCRNAIVVSSKRRFALDEDPFVARGDLQLQIDSRRMSALPAMASRAQCGSRTVQPSPRRHRARTGEITAVTIRPTSSTQLAESMWCANFAERRFFGTSGPRSIATSAEDKESRHDETSTRSRRDKTSEGLKARACAVVRVRRAHGAIRWTKRSRR